MSIPSKAGAKRSHAQHGQSAPPWRCPSSAPVPPQGAPGGSGRRPLSGGDAGPLGAQPLPRVLERAASKAAHFPALTTQALNSTGKWCHVVDEATNMVFDGNIAKYHGAEATYSCYDAGVKVRGSANPNPEPKPWP